MNRYWMCVLFSGFLEILWVTGLKYSETTLQWAGTFVAIMISFVMIIIATKFLPVGTVYAIFAGIGTGGTVIVEMLFFGEPFSLLKIGLIVLLLAGVMGLKVITSAGTEPIGEEGKG
ncbi:DMT family transporter [Paenibacillus agricola]|uniref:DMT family transporter n=1 Tax=Paenibacillus agricola TaxID=2716264 RepID=UPI0024419180|nr:multidrug efflux SMR transporter [Paenibacillus agricola]